MDRLVCGRPEADRPHPALQPGHLHRPLRRRTQGVRGHGRGDASAVTAWAGSPSTWRAGAARPARARASSASSCSSCPARTRRARTAAGARYNPETLEVTYRGRNIAEVLDLTVEAAAEFFADTPAGGPQPADAARRRPRLSAPRPAGHRAVGRRGPTHQAGQRVAARSRRGHTLYLLDEPTTGLHPADVEVLMRQLHGLVDAGTLGGRRRARHGGGGGRGLGRSTWARAGATRAGRIVAAGPPRKVAGASDSATAPYLANALG